MNQAVMSADQSPSITQSELVKSMAKGQRLDPSAFAATVKASCFQEGVTREQFLAFLMIAKEHDLNPITREIYAFTQGNRVQPIVSIDGWIKIINSHPQFDGMEFEDHVDPDGQIIAITCRMYRKDRKRPTQVTEYLSECERNTQVWKQWPIRMLRHKATIQCARYTFGFSGIVDPDEAERIQSGETLDGVATEVPDEAPQSASKRVLQKLKPKVTEDEMPPPEAPESPVQDDPPKAEEKHPVDDEWVEAYDKAGKKGE